MPRRTRSSHPSSRTDPGINAPGRRYYARKPWSVRGGRRMGRELIAAEGRPRREQRTRGRSVEFERQIEMKIPVSVAATTKVRPKTTRATAAAPIFVITFAIAAAGVANLITKPLTATAEAAIMRTKNGVAAAEMANLKPKFVRAAAEAGILKPKFTLAATKAGNFKPKINVAAIERGVLSQD